jgi:peptide/nickel transport system permease protein
MAVYLVKKLATGVVLCFAISVIAFVLLHAGGGNIAQRLLGPTAGHEQVVHEAARLGLNKPVLTQYIHWLTGVIHGSFGDSWFTGQDVTDAITLRIGTTLSIVIGAVIFAAALGALLGIASATRGGFVGVLMQIVSVLGFAVPSFLLAVGLVLLFAINLGWFRAGGVTPLLESPGGWIASVTLPIVALGIGPVAALAQQIRGTVLDTLQLDFVRTLRSRGISRNRVLYVHVLRNAGGPALSVLGVQFIGLLGGVVVIEQVFAIPGIGQLAVQATAQSDIPIVMGLIMVTTILVVISNIVVDLLQAALNPKVRLV